MSSIYDHHPTKKDIITLYVSTYCLLLPAFVSTASHQQNYQTEKPETRPALGSALVTPSEENDASGARHEKRAIL